MTSSLFQPCTIPGHKLKNRFAMAPMTRARATADGTPTDIMTTYYEQRSEAGLIISEGTNITPQGQGFPNTPGIFRDSHVEGWKKVTDRVHVAGSCFFLQLWHVGRIGHPDSMGPGLQPLAPSAIAFERDVMTATGLKPAPQPRAMEQEEIDATVADYAKAAERALEAGCDGVEIHAANGYLPGQFLHQSSNKRTDKYGGSIENRVRFVTEVAQACADAVGAGKVGIRLTPFSGFNGAFSDDEPALYRHLLQCLANIGLLYVHVVGAEIAGNRTRDAEECTDIPNVAEFTRPLWPNTLIVGGDYTRQKAQAALDETGVDLVAFGRDFIGNPDLVTRLREGHPLTPRTPEAWYGSGAEGYTDFPRFDGEDR